jgi:hypothetical protein
MITSPEGEDWRFVPGGPEGGLFEVRLLFSL